MSSLRTYLLTCLVFPFPPITTFPHDGIAQLQSLPAARTRRSDVSAERVVRYHFLNSTALQTQLVILDNFALTIPNLKWPVPELFEEEEGFPSSNIAIDNHLLWRGLVPQDTAKPRTFAEAIIICNVFLGYLTGPGTDTQRDILISRGIESIWITLRPIHTVPASTITAYQYTDSTLFPRYGLTIGDTDLIADIIEPSVDVTKCQALNLRTWVVSVVPCNEKHSVVCSANKLTTANYFSFVHDRNTFRSAIIPAINELTSLSHLLGVLHARRLSLLPPGLCEPIDSSHDVRIFPEHSLNIPSVTDSILSWQAFLSQSQAFFTHAQMLLDYLPLMNAKRDINTASVCTLHLDLDSAEASIPPLPPTKTPDLTTAKPDAAAVDNADSVNDTNENDVTTTKPYTTPRTVVTTTKRWWNRFDDDQFRDTLKPKITHPQTPPPACISCPPPPSDFLTFSLVDLLLSIATLTIAGLAFLNRLFPKRSTLSPPTNSEDEGANNSDIFHEDSALLSRPPSPFSTHSATLDRHPSNISVNSIVARPRSRSSMNSVQFNRNLEVAHYLPSPSLSNPIPVIVSQPMMIEMVPLPSSGSASRTDSLLSADRDSSEPEDNL
jgi:hypothetical protein